MPRADLITHLERCAEQIQRGIDEFTRRHSEGQSTWLRQLPVEAVLDAQGRPLIAEMYAQLAQVYIALAGLDAQA